MHALIINSKILFLVAMVALVFGGGRSASAQDKEKKSGAFVTGTQLVEHIKKNRFFYANQRISVPQGKVIPIQVSNCAAANQALTKASLSQGALSGFAVNSNRPSFTLPSGPKLSIKGNKSSNVELKTESIESGPKTRMAESDAFEFSCDLSNKEHRLSLIAIEGTAEKPISWFVTLSIQNEKPSLKLEPKVGSRSRIYTINEAIYRISPGR